MTPPQRQDDTSLARRFAQDGDPRCLEALYRRHVEATFAFSYRYLMSREDAEEATSETWVRAFRALRRGGYSERSAFRTWLFGIVRLVCLERLRQPRLPTLSLSAVGEEHADFVLFAPFAEPKAEIDSALETLSEDHRAVLTLCDLQGFSLPEAAGIMRKSVAATKSLQVRARSALGRALVAEREAGHP